MACAHPGAVTLKAAPVDPTQDFGFDIKWRETPAETRLQFERTVFQRDFFVDSLVQQSANVLAGKPRDTEQPVLHDMYHFVEQQAGRHLLPSGDDVVKGYRFREREVRILDTDSVNQTSKRRRGDRQRIRHNNTNAGQIRNGEVLGEFEFAPRRQRRADFSEPVPLRANVAGDGYGQHPRQHAFLFAAEHQPARQFFAEDTIEVRLGFSVEHRFQIRVAAD